MKLRMGLLNVPTVANSGENAVNPWLVGIFDPVYGRRLYLMWQRCGNLLLSSNSFLIELDLYKSVSYTTLTR